MADISIESLREIQQYFSDREALSEREFVKKLGPYLGKQLTEEDLTKLFMKVIQFGTGLFSYPFHFFPIPSAD